MVMKHGIKYAGRTFLHMCQIFVPTRVEVSEQLRVLYDEEFCDLFRSYAIIIVSETIVKMGWS
jgi:hypothetical protein